jgi:RND family efflux transporter MFP subunit
MTSWKRWAVPVAALAAILLWLAWQARRAPEPQAPAPKPGASAPGPASGPADKAGAVLELLPQDLLEAQVQRLQRGVEVSGSLEATRSAMVKARVAGELKSLTAREGDAVRAGQVLAQIDSTELEWRLRQAQQQAEAAKAQLDIAVRQLANNQALVAQGFISPTALETSVSNDAAARANANAAQAAVALAQKALADATVLAPIGGLVAQRLAQPGERVAIDARLLEIVDLSALELEAAVAPEDVRALRVGATARLHIEGHPDAVPARLARINPSAAAGTRAVTVYLSVGGGPGLRHGLFARGWIEASQQQVLAIPMSAVRTDAAQPYVIRWHAGMAEHRRIGLGAHGRAADGTELVEVASGLQAGDKLLAASAGAVADGTALRLRPQEAKEPKAAKEAIQAPASR